MTGGMCNTHSGISVLLMLAGLVVHTNYLVEQLTKRPAGGGGGGERGRSVSWQDLKTADSSLTDNGDNKLFFWLCSRPHHHHILQISFAINIVFDILAELRRDFITAGRHSVYSKLPSGQATTTKPDEGTQFTSPELLLRNSRLFGKRGMMADAEKRHDV